MNVERFIQDGESIFKVSYYIGVIHSESPSDHVSIQNMKGVLKITVEGLSGTHYPKGKYA